LILIVAPWSAFWDQNAFTQADALRPFLESPFVRGGVSGIGLITALAGFAELAGAFRRRSASDEEPSAH
jgi:hypothetical protein